MYVENAVPNEYSWLEEAKGIVKSVNYSDVPIFLTLFFHVISLAFLIFSRKHTYVSSVYFVILVFLISMTPKINYYMLENWNRFGFTVNYFDKSYVFIMVFWVLPLSSCCIIMMTMLVIDIIRSFFVGRASYKNAH